MTTFNDTAQLHGHGLLAVADRHDRNAGVEHVLRRAGTSLAGDGVRAAGEDHALRLQLLKSFARLLIRPDFAIDARLANAPGNQLRDLAAEIDDEDGFRMGVV